MSVAVRLGETTAITGYWRPNRVNPGQEQKPSSHIRSHREKGALPNAAHVVGKPDRRHATGLDIAAPGARGAALRIETGEVRGSQQRLSEVSPITWRHKASALDPPDIRPAVFWPAGRGHLRQTVGYDDGTCCCPAHRPVDREHGKPDRARICDIGSRHDPGFSLMRHERPSSQTRRYPQAPTAPNSPRKPNSIFPIASGRVDREANIQGERTLREVAVEDACPGLHRPRNAGRGGYPRAPQVRFQPTCTAAHRNR
ncbi:hypothetical protein RIdsm_01905 [Roseovarius indicus]|uniref:Uncharacterized protein n=1 Tax=Roseovarius indicus TaxID=540747 RepID=A0A5P3AA89_9RHOB|nr:hypothetical protein RIdsm_01905 [Roseovarius indicus]SFD93441.1 hypothetical protein SAMN04488031_103318 [Roseovarius indicus]